MIIMARRSGVAAIVCILASMSIAVIGAEEIFGRTTSCAVECPSTSIFSYENNMVHVFDYLTSAKIFGGIDEPELIVTSRVHITVASPCEMILALSHVKLSPATATNAGFVADLTSTPLRFAFHNGKVSNICPSTDEPIWVLNFKRAVLSTFQNNMGSLTEDEVVIVREEIDVSGTCVSAYTSVQPEPGLFNITRKRTSNCISKPVPETNCRLNSLLQLLPVFKKEQTCHQKISGGVLKDSICSEQIRYPDFMDQPESLPIIDVVTQLTSAYQFKADFVVIPNYNATRTSLIQDWEQEDTVPTPDWMETVLDILGQFGNIDPSPELFYGLTEILRKLDFQEIEDLFIAAAPKLWNNAAMSFISVGTEPAFKILVDLMRNGILSGNKLQDTVDYLVKKFDVQSSMLDLIANVINQNEDSASPLVKVKNYCERNSSCIEDNRIIDIQKDLDRSRELMCNELSKNNSDYVEYDSYEIRRDLAQLQNLKSFGRWNSTTASGIDSCIESSDANVKYTALRAILSAPCDQFDYLALLNKWKNVKMDAMTQILTYKALARCPTDQITDVVKQKLLLEDVNQVTSYIWSHIQNFKEQPWTLDMRTDARLSNKFNKANLKFSRHIRNDYNLSNKTFTIECDIIFSSTQLIPQYASMKISSNEFFPNDIFETNLRFKNETLDEMAHMMAMMGMYEKQFSFGLSPKYKVSLLREVTLFGFTISEKEILLDSFLPALSSNAFYDQFFMFGYKLMAKFSFEYIYEYFSRISKVNYIKYADIKLRYPTSMGMPIHLNLNSTSGSHEGGLLLSTAKTIESQLILDATHAKIGCKLIASSEFLPNLEASYQSGELGLSFKLPEEKTTIVNMDYGLYTFVNDELKPKFFVNETEATSLCVPGIQSFTGFTICWDYYPRMRYWPIYNFKYGISYQRDPDVSGIDIVGRFNDRANMMQLGLSTPGRSSGTWNITKYTFGRFINANLTTPYFKLEGAGIYDEDSLFTSESGEAFNISGNFYYEGDVAPFTLINKNTYDPVTERTDVSVDFISSIFSTNLAVGYNLENNSTVNIDIPYKIRNDKQERFRLSFAGRELKNIVSDKRFNYQTTEVTKFERNIYSASMGHTTFKKPLLYLEMVCESSKEVDTMYANIKMSGHDNSLNTTLSYVCTDTDYWTFNSSSIYESPTTRGVFSEDHVFNNNSAYIKSSFLLNNDSVYDFNANYANISGQVIQSNASFVVPNHEDDAEYPLFEVRADQKFNYTGQYFYTYLYQACDDKIMNFNVSVKKGQNTVSTGNRLSQSYINYLGDISLLVSEYNPFKILVATSYAPQSGNSEKSLAVDAKIQTPITRWNKDALKMKFEGDKKHMKMVMTDNRYKPITYTMEGSPDYDIITNLIDASDEKFGKP